MRRIFVFALLASILLLAAACGAQSGPGGAPAVSGNSGYGANASFNTKFPLPGTVSNFTETGEDSINFQTTTDLEATIAFYRESFGKAGLTERTINTAISETTFSLVFDGDPSGKALVVQGVDLGNGQTNVNIRYEDV